MKKEIMDWDKCAKESIRKVEADMDKIRSMVKMAKIELEIIAKIPVTDESASKLVKDYYEIIKELMIALLLSHGLKSENHECLISFVKHQYPQCEYEIGIIHELRGIRNRISYDGFFIEKDYLSGKKLEFEHITGMLKKLIGENVPELGQMD
ncbi:hypothetical protein HYV84_06275 [Candidatus Woesearchaeota archaeon]|nr:hypothetical protein [Candidatus Woesearchaeota archaeon]